MYEKVKEYIENNIFYCKPFEDLGDNSQRKAVIQAESILYIYYKRYNPTVNPLPIEAIAYQTMWEVEKVAVRPSDLGVASQSIEGMTQTFRGMDRAIAPEVLRILRNRVGSYNISPAHTYRGMITQ